MFRQIILSFVASIVVITTITAQNSKLYLTTSVGLLAPLSTFERSYKTSLALNSGVEYKLGQSLFTQFVLDFNAVKYSQQIRDNNSGYLFQRTNSSIFLAGINLGKNISLKHVAKFFSSVYAGAGYINIGEPRLSVNTNTTIIEQNVQRAAGVFAKAGGRIGYITASKILQTIYIDGSYWVSNLIIQQSRAQAVSLYIGTRIGF